MKTLKRTLVIFIITLLMVGCVVKQDGKDKVYFVIKHNKPTLSQKYYGRHNFILMDNSMIFYHKEFENRFCGAGLKDETKPPRLFLIPDSLKEIKIDELQNFLTTYNPEYPLESASISSPTDTIRNRAFSIITDYFKSKKVLFFVRHWTEEENYVTIAKITNHPYDANVVDWKIGFSTVEFTPPTKE